MFDFVTLILFFIVACIAWYWRWERSDFVRKIDLIPGPPGKLPILGNTLDFPRTGHGLFQAFLIRWVKEYGPVYRVWRGLQPIVMLSSAETVEIVMSSQKNIDKSNTAKSFIPWIGEGLLLSNGEKWREDRRLLTPAFHFQILNDFFEVFNRNSEIFVQQIARKLETSREMDIASMASQCTLDIICEAAMGIQINAQLNDGDSDYIKATEEVELKLQQRVNSAFGVLPDWFYYNFTSHGRECQRLLDLVHGLTRKVLKERKEEMAHSNSDESSNEKKRKPFLQLLLEATKQGIHMSDEEILSQVDTFMFEGHDTTSGAITWYLYCMATHHEEQDRVYEEIYNVFGKSNRSCTMEDLPKLKYFDCCLKESMRVHPSVPTIRRRINEEVTIGGYTLPANTNVQMQIYAVHHDEKHFSEPYSFKPKRFLPENSIGRHPFAFVPFSAGPRNCIGQKFATYEDKVVLTTLMRKYRFDIDPRHYPIKESLKMVLKTENGMPLLITSR